MKKCNTCRWWLHVENRYISEVDPDVNPITLKRFKTLEEKKKCYVHEVRYCTHPKVLFYRRPSADGRAVFDGSMYQAFIATGQDFGCINHEAIEKNQGLD